MELAIKKRDLYRKEENYAKVQQCTAVITEMSNLISRLEDFDTESMPKPRMELSSPAKAVDEKLNKTSDDQDDDIKSEDLEWFLTVRIDFTKSPLPCLGRAHPKHTRPSL